MRLRRPELQRFPQDRSQYRQIGEHAVPHRLQNQVYTWLEDESDAAVLTVTVDVTLDRHGLACNRMVIESGTQTLTRRVVGQLDPLWFAADALGVYGFAVSGTDGSIFTPDPTGANAELAALPRRRSVTPDRLAEVAAAYERDGSAGVVHDCFVSRSQAFRLVSQARAAGYLPPKDAS